MLAGWSATIAARTVHTHTHTHTHTHRDGLVVAAQQTLARSVEMQHSHTPPRLHCTGQSRLRIRVSNRIPHWRNFQLTRTSNEHGGDDTRSLQWLSLSRRTAGAMGTTFNYVCDVVRVRGHHPARVLGRCRRVHGEGAHLHSLRSRSRRLDGERRWRKGHSLRQHTQRCGLVHRSLLRKRTPRHGHNGTASQRQTKQGGAYLLRHGDHHLPLLQLGHPVD